MAHYLLHHKGLFVGLSTAMNDTGALMVALQIPEGSNIVTIVCDGGQ
jgi:cysteine synthase A